MLKYHFIRCIIIFSHIVVKLKKKHLSFVNTLDRNDKMIYRNRMACSTLIRLMTTSYLESQHHILSAAIKTPCIKLCDFMCHNLIYIPVVIVIKLGIALQICFVICM